MHQEISHFHSSQVMIRTDFEAYHYREPHFHSLDFHSHDFYELYVFLDGSVTYYIEDKVYELCAGDLLLIPPGRQKIWHGRRMQLLCTELLCDFGLAEYAGAAPSSLPAVLHQRLLLVRSVVQQKRFVVIEGASDR